MPQLRDIAKSRDHKVYVEPSSSTLYDISLQKYHDGRICLFFFSLRAFSLHPRFAFPSGNEMERKRTNFKK